MCDATCVPCRLSAWAVIFNNIVFRVIIGLMVRRPGGAVLTLHNNTWAVAYIAPVMLSVALLAA